MTAHNNSSNERTFPATKANPVRPTKPKASSRLAATRVPVRLPNKMWGTKGQFYNRANKDRLSSLRCIYDQKLHTEAIVKGKPHLPTMFTTDSFLFLSAPVSKSYTSLLPHVNIQENCQQN